MSIARLVKWGAPALVAVALSLMVGSPARAQARADYLPDSLPPNAEWVLLPSQPCLEDDVVLCIRGYEATPCDSFISAYRTGERDVVVRTLVVIDRQCFAAPYEFFSVPIHFGPLPPGPQSLTIHHHWLSQMSDGSLDSTVTDST